MAGRMRFLCGPSLRACYKGRHRTFGLLPQCRHSAHDESSSRPRNETVVVFEASGDQSQQAGAEIYVKTHDDKFGEQFRHFPLPGNSTTSQHFLGVKAKSSPLLQKSAFRNIGHCLESSDVPNTMTTHERQYMALYIFAEAAQKFPPNDSPSLPPNLPPETDCSVYTCPQLVRKDLANLFPNRDIKNGVLTVITLMQNPSPAAGGLTDEVEEQEERISQFISTAVAVCDFLRAEGHWAEFIDPTSARRYLGPFISAATPKLEHGIDRRDSFIVEVLSSCKIIHQAAFTPGRLTVSIFCDAPTDSPVLRAVTSPAPVENEKSDDTG